MLNRTETARSSPTVPVVPAAHPCPGELHFISQMPNHVTFGHLTLTNDHEEFLQGVDAGIESSCEIGYETQQMTAQELLHDLGETICDAGTSLAWRLGFIAGEVAGMLNPDLAEMRSGISCLEVLTRKCQVLYPGPGLVSTYLHALHQATGFDLMDVEVVPSSPCTLRERGEERAAR
jgi:hypothetical protein